MNRIYLDYAATTPVRPSVAAAMQPHLSAHPSNPSSLHAEGRAARAALDDARSAVAQALGVRSREIVFTSSGTEASNLAILGAARARRAQGMHLITAATEHHAVLRAFERLRSEGYSVTVLPVDGEGRLDPATFARAITLQTTFASIMLGNNEVGTLHPIAELAAIAREHEVVFHTDAVAAIGQVPVDVRALGADLLSLSAHKFYGPKGAGALYVREGTSLLPLLVGGAQELGLRAGTENVAGIVGMAEALTVASAELPEAALRLAALRDRLEAGIKERFPAVRINGAGARRLPGTTNVSFPHAQSASLLARLDLDGVAASAGSACAAGALERSHVIAALGVPRWAQEGVVRFSLGTTTAQDEIDEVLRRLPGIVESASGAAIPAGVSF
ncbi:MAG TPA: cysteine desulfurase family protein [Candidatus Acidoferrales bacterium]|nr:cysteine desulfurase family protein [Candidatus Acidoferrales bacterium]